MPATASGSLYLHFDCQSEQLVKFSTLGMLQTKRPCNSREETAFLLKKSKSLRDLFHFTGRASSCLLCDQELPQTLDKKAGPLWEGYCTNQNAPSPTKSCTKRNSLSYWPRLQPWRTTSLPSVLLCVPAIVSDTSVNTRVGLKFPKVTLPGPFHKKSSFS